MRNSNCVAIAPTATISNIIGVAASIEPEYQNIYVKSNLSGEFTVVNEQLVRDLKDIGQWDEVMVADLKYFDGSLAKIDRVPAEMRELYATRFESRRSGSSKPARAARSGSTRRRASTSTWRARRARSSTRRTSSRGCAVSRRRTTCARSRRRRPRSRPAAAGELNAVSAADGQTSRRRSRTKHRQGMPHH
jgi:hypothetical protein